MHRINKLDYFIGVFLTTILNSSRGVPALFDETNDSKRVEFVTDTGDFNAYVKYSTNMRKATVNTRGRKRKKLSWNISFSDKEYEILRENFYIEGKKNLVCLVCTNEKLNDTYLAVLGYEKAMKCLEKSTASGNRRITVTRTGAEYNFSCYGVGFTEENYIQISVDPTNFLGLKD